MENITEALALVNSLYDEAQEKASKGELKTDMYTYVAARYKGIDPNNITPEQKESIKGVRAIIKNTLFARAYGADTKKLGDYMHAR